LPEKQFRFSGSGAITFAMLQRETTMPKRNVNHGIEGFSSTANVKAQDKSGNTPLHNAAEVVTKYPE
jgi:hypothetical protein